MIFPFLKGLGSPILTPFVYMLLALNLLVFGTTYPEVSKIDEEMNQTIENDAFLATQGSLFAIMIHENKELFSSMLQKMARQVRDGERESRRTLGVLALRNTIFMRRASDYEFGGDEIAVASWRAKFEEFKSLQAYHPSYLWGLTDQRQDWTQWVSYQFAHGGFTHLFWNMLFLLLFGAFVESQMGGLWLIVTYIASGLTGALAFALLSGVSSSPLVGASGAISGLIGLTVAWSGRRPLDYVYMLMPAQGYCGMAKLPSWLVLVIFVLPDISGYISAHTDFGSVAYTAHLGGVVTGLGLGLLAHVLFPVAEENGSITDRSDNPKQAA